MKPDKTSFNQVVALKDKPNKPIGRICGFYEQEAILCPLTGYRVPLNQLVLYEPPSLGFKRADKGCGKTDPILSHDLAESDRKGRCNW